ncbi:unnamed protein product [Brassicogethes aeneus]|uniref:Proteasome activator complex subunit 4 n=1 Tax=Brassicogethes aeneus TaxID=1431903 RepID=A0A9P0FCQ8_BRAAE|nr:unnamed protein product [Brassicogethes aeneus]
MDEDVENGNDRLQKLGFKPQKENVYNKFLPYAADLDEESTKLFTDIKTNLVKSVLAREMRPGCALWTSRLNKYIKIYGLKFSKEDHIALIKLFYELVIIPDLEPSRINKSATTLTSLLKKKYLISRDELQLDWRPLYDVCVRTMEKSKSDLGMFRYFSTFENSIFDLIRAARIYFPASATQDILDEFRPYLCPFNSEITSAIQLLEMFLPICVKPEEADISYKLWLEEFLTLWDVCHNASTWENHMMWLLARLSIFNMGRIDWEPYVSTMFARFIRTLQLPVVFKQKQLGKHHKIDIFPIAIWITSTLNGDKNSVFYQFEKFMHTLESYFYQANNGRWTGKLRELIRKLSYYFVQRVHYERYKKQVWEMHIVDSFRLTDDDIDRFVNVMRPCVEQAMFSRMGQQETCLTLQYLASLRPNIIVPVTLEKLSASMDSLTEPHKLTSSMMGVIAVGRYMVQGKNNNYPEGPTHVVPLLMALLPGIDPNDVRKSYVTFSFIVHFVNMIPLINSSDAHNHHKDLSEEEHIVCEATANFEDFVLQFLDRLCTWVESSSLDFVRLEMANSSNNNKNRSETFAETALASVITVVLTQCSPDIFNAALKKIYNFTRDKIMEIYISGRMLAVACHCFARVNPKETLKLFVPHLCDRINELFNENSNVQNEENIDDELLYNLCLLSELFNGRSEILNYIDDIIPILDRTLHMTSEKASPLAARLLDLIMFSLTYILPVDAKSSPVHYGTHVKDFLSIREWGRPQPMKDLKIEWYVPGDKEIALVQKLLNKYLIPELEKLDKHSSSEVTLTRQELKRTLKIVNSILSCHFVLPIWEEPAEHLVDSVLEPWAFNMKVSGPHIVTMPDGRNVRKVVSDTLHKLQKKILETDEGDTKSLRNLIQIYNIILFNKSNGHDFEMHWKNFHLSKKMLEDRLIQNKLHLRHVLIDRALLHQEFRIESRNCSFSATHKQIMLDLFELSVSRYSEVRMYAQSKLLSVVSLFPYSYTLLKPKIVEILGTDSAANHEAFKGCLYVLIGPKISPIAARHDWELIRDLWPAIVKSKPSEKVSIINLIGGIGDSVHRFFPTIAIKLIIPDSCIEAALSFCNAEPKVTIGDNFKNAIDNSKQYLQSKSDQRRLAYDTLLNSLLDACENGNLHWRYHMMALNFMRDLVHFDVKYNSRIVKYFLKCTISDSIKVRKSAMRVLVFITVQNKPKFKKVPIDPFKFSAENGGGKKIVPGYRSDNEWLLYSSSKIPKNESEWNEHRYVHDVYAGYYAWPNKMEVYAPYDEQPTVYKRLDNMNDTEKEIYNFFTNEENIAELIKYMSLEEKKGHDQFNAYRYLVYKNLFKMYEDALLPHFLPHIVKLVSDKQESSQRCASELIAGIIKGAKHWNYEKSENLWKSLIPLVNTVFANISSEAVNDWSICFTMALEWRDPKRNHWILEHLLDDPLKNPTSFIGSARLQMLFIALNQQHWRNIELHRRLFDYFKNHLSHPFQNIRDRISMLLCLVLSTDITFPEGNRTKGPLVSEFFGEVMPQLDRLYGHLLQKVNTNGNRNDVEKTCEKLALVEITSDEERENAFRLFKIVSRYITQSVVRMNVSTLPEFFDLLPLASVLQSNDTDEEIAPCSVNLLVVLAQAMSVPKNIPHALEAIKRVAKSPFWSARAVMAEFLSVFVFYNMPSFHANQHWVTEVENLVLDLIEDVQPEVRENSAKVLSGLLHCKFLPKPMELLTKFQLKARTKLKKNVTSKGKEVGNLRTRHAGVLGLCAYISSHPYDVPDYMPSIFGDLGPHLNDPQPIPATIRKTLGDFKRTHHDNWEMHKMKFTEEELSVLSDLTVPPSYYA